MAKVIKTQTLAGYKLANKISKINIFKSSKGNLYACDEADNFVGMLAEDFDSSKPVLVHNMMNEETGETWNFLVNGEKTVEFTL
jgi:hypothetical protein